MTRTTQNEQGNSALRAADMARLSVTVYGRVQGVYFRDFVRSVARELGLKGYVRNLASGDAVEVEVEGEKRWLEKLLDRVKIGPARAVVRRVDIQWLPYTGQFDDFTIRH